MTSVFSWQNSISLYPASFCTPRPNLPVTPGVSWLPAFAFQSPIMKRTSFLGVSSRRLVGLHRTVQLQILQRYWLGHRLGLLWYWMVCLGNEQRSFCHFWDCIQVLYFELFCWPWWLLHVFWGIPAHSSRYNGSTLTVSTLTDLLDCLIVWITTNRGKLFRSWEYQTTWPASWEICMQVRKQQLELDMEQQTGSK